MFMCCLAKIDLKSAFLQTGDARRDVYVVSPRKSSDKNHYWFLRTASYNLVYYNATRQEHSDYLLKIFGLKKTNLCLTVVLSSRFYWSFGTC